MHRLLAQTPRSITPDWSRRRWLQAASAAAIGAAASTPNRNAWAQGSDKPEKEEVRIGFIPLTDCASVVMASVLGFDKKYGVKIIPTKEASWAGVRDKLVNGELDMAHVLYGLVYGVHLGLSGPKKDMAVLMSLNNNGQAITLSKALADKGAVDGASLAAVMAKDKRDYTFAGPHASDVDPLPAGRSGIDRSRRQGSPSAAADGRWPTRVGNMDGFCVGEPGDRGDHGCIGITATTGPPGKVLGPPATSSRSTPTPAAP
jgi:nitrate/nitrite transport system substrate-binding protein